MTATSPEPSALSNSNCRARLGPWLVLWGVTAVVEVALLVNNAALDTLLWNRTQEFLGEPPRMLRAWEIFRTVGEPLGTFIILLLIAVYSRRRWMDAGTGLLATLLAGGLGALIRIIDGRYRPTHTHGANVWELFRGFHSGKDLAFPSGHATLAFATVAVLCYVSPRGRWVFVPLAAACAFSRVAMGAHFYSDVLFGAVLGWTVAWWVMHVADAKFADAQK